MRRMIRIGHAIGPLACLVLAACSGGNGSPAPAATDSASPAPAAAPAAAPTVATAADTATFAGVGADEIVHFTGTEPFWGGQASGKVLTYTTPENQTGDMVAVDRFAGRNGISYSGQLDDMPFVLAVTPGKCSDGMSDRSYPYTVTLLVRGEKRQGCAWTDRQSFTGAEQP
jgi:uncharacterized membrane protein